MPTHTSKPRSHLPIVLEFVAVLLLPLHVLGKLGSSYRAPGGGVLPPREEESTVAHVGECLVFVVVSSWDNRMRAMGCDVMGWDGICNGLTYY